jgi:flagellin
MTALQVMLSMTRQAAQPVRSKAPAGIRLGSAEDDGADWSISATIRSIAASLRSDKEALSPRKPSLNLGASSLDTAFAVMKGVIEVVHQIKQGLVRAAEPYADRSRIQTDIAALQGQLESLARSASFNGHNLLSTDSSARGYNATTSVVASLSSDPTGAVSIRTIDIDQSKIKLFDATRRAADKGILDFVDAATGFSVRSLAVSALTDSDADMTKLAELAAQVDAAIQSIGAAASTLGAIQARINLQANCSAIHLGRPALDMAAPADANMNEASTTLNALPSEQQLRNQPLLVANQDSQLILKLFGD